MKVHFWSSTEYLDFLKGLIRELNVWGEVRQRFKISEGVIGWRSYCR